uniref:Uncharacterized protein n=1 Tax=Panagrolaimus sp. JU765 TaxID=591449 RepID=A0AC34RFR9_9BILA
MRNKALALIYVFATATVAPKRRKSSKKKKKELRTVLTGEQYKTFVEIPKTGIIDDSNGAIVAWSMGLSNHTRNNFIQALKEDYKGTPKTRHQAKVFADTASPKVQKAWRRYNRMLQSDLSMVQILEKVEEMDTTVQSVDETDDEIKIKGRNCQLGSCEKWDIVIIPILQENSDYLGALKDLVGAVVGDCKWYYGYVNVKCLTKDFELVPINDPVEFSDLNCFMEKFVYNETEQIGAYERTLVEGIRKMPRTSTEFGRYILMVSNLERPFSGTDSMNATTAEFGQLDEALATRGIQLRTIRVEFVRHRVQHLDKSYFVYSQQIRNVSSNIVRISLTESDSVLSTIRPCPPLTAREKIAHYRYAKHYLAQYWIQENYRSSLIGAICLVCACFMSIGAVIFHFYEKRRENSNG